MNRMVFILSRPTAGANDREIRWSGDPAWLSGSSGSKA
jgi:hypothetical protein